MRLALLFTLTLLTSSLAFADIHISSNFNARAIELPNGYLQISNPSITIQGKTYQLINGSNTAQVFCKSIGMDLIEHDGDSAAPGLISFDNGTTMVVNKRSYRMMNTLTCSKR